MTEQNATPETATTEATEQKIDGRTKRALDTAIVKKQVSQESYRAVLEGRIDLKAAKDLGRNAGPSGPAVRVDKNDRSRDCLCGCGNRTRGGRFAPGHDQRMVTLAKAHVRGEADLTDEQMEYVEASGKVDRARLQVEKEEQKRQEAAAKKAEAQRRKEGRKAEAKRRNAEK